MSSADVIILNVGGTRLKTTRMTLMADSKSLLAKMFELNSTFSPSKLEDGGAYFMDADPEAFKVVLHFLRYNTVVIPPSVPVAAVKDEATFFGLERMLESLSTKIKINAGGKMFEVKKETLTQKRGGKMCKLGKMVEKGEIEIFVDADPFYFEIILNLLRYNDGNLETMIDKKARYDINRPYYIEETAKKCGIIIENNGQGNWHQLKIKGFFNN